MSGLCSIWRAWRDSELPTARFVAEYSIQLSYRRKMRRGFRVFAILSIHQQTLPTKGTRRDEPP